MGSNSSTNKKRITTRNCVVEEHWSNAEALLKTSNPRSKKAESYLLDHGLIDPQQINLEMAKFIFNRANTLQQPSAWEYIRHRDNITTARAFINLLDLSKPLPTGLKEMFLKLKPNHAFENFLELYAEEYYRANPGLIMDRDAAFVLTYSTTVLMVSMLKNMIESKAAWIKQMQAEYSEFVFDVNLLEQIYDDAEKNCL